MNDELAERYAQALRETLGYPGRMISYSKTDYVVRRFPDHVVCFNGNVCIGEGKLWHGDLDLTLGEPHLAALAEQIGEIVYVVYEGDGRFANESQPLLDRAVYSVTPTGHTKYQHTYIARNADGTLRSRPSPPPGPRWRWRVFAHRPRLFHFWSWDRRSRTDDEIERVRSALIYIGKRDGGATPLLVLVFVRGERLRIFSFELTWYPAGSFARSAGRELFKLNLGTRLGWRLQLWAHAVAWPGRMYSFQATYRVRRREW